MFNEIANFFRQVTTMLPFSGRPWMLLVPAFILVLSAPASLHALEMAARIDLTQHPVGYLPLLNFFVACGFVAVEKATRMASDA